MKVLIKKVSDLFCAELNIKHRGIMVSIISCKESNPKMTLAKCKVSFPFKNYIPELVYLHENNFIEWSGYKNAKKSLENIEYHDDVILIIDFMNKLYKRNFKVKTYNTITLGILKDNSIKDVKLVISNRYKVWKDDSFMSKYLTPSTIFRPKHFDKYLEEALHTRVGESIISADRIELKNGDEITSKIAKTFIDSDTYDLKIYSTDGEGNKRGSGKSITRYGKDIRKLMSLQDTNEKYNGVREYLYFYLAK